MRTHLILAESFPTIDRAVADARAYLGPLNVTITTERRAVDISLPAVYETDRSWSGLILGNTKSLKSAFIFGLASLEQAQKSDCIGLIVAKEKALYEDDDLLGQHNTFGVKEVIEVYALGNKRTKFGMPIDSYVLIHEILHALADHHRTDDGLHRFLDKKPKTIDAYKEDLLGRIIKSPMGLLPLVQKKADQLVAYAASIGTPIRITEGYRSHERQNELYNQRPKVTNAKGGESMHQYRVAFDIVFRNEGYNATDAQWKKVADYAKSLGLDWGGDWRSFKDKPHFELTFGKSVKDFQKGNIDWTKYYDTAYEFTRDLTVGSTGEDVRELQKYLNAKGFRVSWFGAGSPGHESDYFGNATKSALARFQFANGIQPAAGYFGPITRTYISTHP